MKRFALLLLALLFLLSSCVSNPKPDYDELESMLNQRDDEILRLEGKIDDLESLLRKVHDQVTPLFCYFEDNSGSYAEAYNAYEEISHLLVDY